MNQRAVTPVIGTVLMVVVTLLLASMLSVLTTGVAEFGDDQTRVDDLTDGTPTPTPTEDGDNDEDDDGEDGDDGEDDEDEED